MSRCDVNSHPSLRKKMYSSPLECFHLRMLLDTQITKQMHFSLPLSLNKYPSESNLHVSFEAFVAKQIMGHVKSKGTKTLNNSESGV